MGVSLRPSPYLRHVESGTVSISATGQELAFGLARSLTLDATHLVGPRTRSFSLGQAYPLLLRIYLVQTACQQTRIRCLHLLRAGTR